MADISKITTGGAEYDVKDAKAREALKKIEIPEALPNPNKLTFTGAVEAEYDGSSAVSVTIPAGGGADISLGITGATVGQVAKIAAVDAAGKPTAWEAADMAGGGGTMHTVTWDLANVTSSSTVTEVSDGGALIATLSPADGYKLGAVSVTMGGAAQSEAWNADTSTVTIPSVTGDVIVSCTGVEDEPVGPVVDTSPVIEVSGKGINPSGRVYAKDGWGYTKYYPISDTSITTLYTNTAGLGAPTSNARMTVCLDTDDGSTPFALLDYANPLSDANVGKQLQWNFPSGATGLRASLVLADLENCYLYETNTGNVIFAGKNTPYYGLANIGNAPQPESAQNLSVDQDIAMDYAVATTSVLGETPAEDPKTAYGVSEELTALITDAKNAWMTEYGGDYRKIPLIITTDQHGRTNAGIFKLLGDTLSMHDVSKICNLGDTVSVEWKDEDTAHPLLSCAALEKWCESVKDIPYSKQLNVFGNHDTWYANYEDEGNPIGTRYPSIQAHLDQYFRNVYARRTNNNGWFSVIDDHYNVKYVVISGFEYQGGSVKYRIGTAQMDWIIDELSKNDGYDIIVVSHIPLYYDGNTNVYPTGMAVPDDTHTASIWRVADGLNTDDLFNARKNKTSGTVLDSDDVSHEFDFSPCATDLLCGLHGHSHIDAYNYVGGTGLMNATFDWFADNTLHFILIDRTGKKVNVWKVEGTALETTNYQIPLDKPSE